MMYRIRAISYIFLLGIVLVTGCSRATPPEKAPLAGAHQKFLKICQEQQFNAIFSPQARGSSGMFALPKMSTLAATQEKLTVLLHPLQHTAWIYVPLQKELVQLAATPEGPKKSETFEERPTVKYIHSAYENQRFIVSYDIRPEKTYAQSQGTKLDYVPLYHQISRQIMTAVSQAYFDAADAPSFFVVVIADVINGVEIENIFYLEDLKRYMMFENIPQEEFVKRSLYEMKGKAAWAGDTEGRHLAYSEITMPEFLARQITSRVNFKYQKSSFPPSNDARGEILNIVAETLKNYNFTDFNYVELRDLAAGLTETVSPTELTHKAEQPDTSGSPAGDSLRSR